MLSNFGALVALKKLSVLRIACLLLAGVLSLSAWSQIDFDKYRTQKCAGEIPSEFLVDFSDYLSTTYDEMSDEMAGEDVGQTLENAAISVALSHHLFFKKGQILFGDPITLYLNEIKNHLLRDDPELADEVDIFTMRTSAVNAFTTVQGDVFVTVGLLARMQSEAELAFVISHEIAHFEAGHTYDRIRTTEEVSDLRKVREEMTYDDMVRMKMQRNREQEFEADKMGFKRFKDSDYAPSAAVSLIAMLGRSHLPVNDIPWDPSFFNGENFVVPACFMLDEVSAIDLDEDYEDALQTHPNIKKRKEALREMLDPDWAENQTQFILERSDFEQAREIASFELVDALISNRQYGEALYTAYCMLELHGESEFLNLALCKALYGVSRYKSAQKLAAATRSYSDMEGQSQNCYYLIKQLSPKHLCALSIRRIEQMRQQHPEMTLLDEMLADLVHTMKSKYKKDLNDFFDEQEAADAVDALVSDYNPELTPRENRRAHGDFYLCALYDLKSEHLKIVFDEADGSLKRKPRFTNRLYISDYKNGVLRGTEVLEGQLTAIDEGKILVLPPEVTLNGRRRDTGIEVVELSEDGQAQFIDIMEAAVASTSRDDEVFDWSNMLASEVEEYNLYAEAIRWITEWNGQLSKVSLPSLRDGAGGLLATSGFRYVVATNAVDTKWGLVYNFSTFDLETGDCIYQRLRILSKGKKRRFANIEKEFERDYLTLIERQ